MTTNGNRSEKNTYVYSEREPMGQGPQKQQKQKNRTLPSTKETIYADIWMKINSVNLNFNVRFKLMKLFFSN